MAEHRTMSVDLTSNDLDDISIGDIVTVKVVGKVMSLDAGKKPTKSEKKDGFQGFPPDMRIDIQSTKVNVSGDFDELSED